MKLRCIDVSGDGFKLGLELGHVYEAEEHPDSYYKGYAIMIGGVVWLRKRFEEVQEASPATKPDIPAHPDWS